MAHVGFSNQGFKRDSILVGSAQAFFFGGRFKRVQDELLIGRRIFFVVFDEKIVLLSV